MIPMIDEKTLAHLDVQSKTADPQEMLQTIMHHWRESIEHLLQVCRLLYLYRQRWTSRSNMWKHICDHLPFNRGTINKLCKIGSDERLFDPDVARHLPPHWGTLYEISSLNDTALYEGIGGEIITAEATRAQIIIYKYETDSGRDDTRKSNIRIREEWIEEYIARTFLIMDLPSHLPIAEQNALELERQNKGDVKAVLNFLQNHRKAIPQVEKKITSMTDRLYTVRVRKTASERSVNEALRKFRELAEINGIVPWQINRKALRDATDRELERTEGLADWIYDLFCVGDWNTALTLFQKPDFVTRLKEYKVEHPLKSVVYHYLEHFDVPDSEIVTDESGQIDFTLIEDWKLIIDKLLDIDPKRWADAPKPTSEQVMSWDFSHGRRAATNPIPEFSTDRMERMTWSLRDEGYDKFNEVRERMAKLRPVPNDWEDWDADELEEFHQALGKEIQKRADAKAEFESQFKKEE